MPEMSSWFVIGVLAAWLLALIAGILIGQRTAAKPLSESEKDRMLRMLHDLESWTNRYADDVSQHKDVLESLRCSLTELLAGQADDERGKRRAAGLLSELVNNNRELEQNLSRAKVEIEQQSQQLSNYLAEARTDSLTGLANRRAFDQQLEAAFSSHRSGGKSFVLALIDVDHFKAANDSLGHPEGDRLLKYLARELEAHLPDAMLLARYGGDEFAILMDGPLLQAAEHLDSIRQRIVHGIGSDHPNSLTISVGMSQPTDDMGAASIIRRADEALYAAKDMGRNRVYHHDGRQPTLVGAPQVTPH